MTKLFRAELHDSQFREEGLGFFVGTGEPITVGGTPMVSLHGGVLVPASGWHADRAAAVRAAADRIDELGRLLLAQAERLRRENAHGAQPSI